MQFLDFLRAQPVFTLFLVLGLGYMVGRLRIGIVSLGPVAGVLFVGLVFGHFGFEMSAGAQAVGFAIFIFSVGYQAGPRFLDALKSNGFKYFTLAAIVSLSGVTIAVVMSRILGLTPGTSAGLLAGGLTSSPTLAAAQEAIRGGIISPPDGWSADQIIGNITTGYAITYIFGLAGLILIIKLLPIALKIDLAAEAQQLEKTSMPIEAESAGKFSFRAYRITNQAVTEMSREKLKAGWDGFSWVRLRRAGKFLSTDAVDRLRLGDEVVAIGDPKFLVRLQVFGEDISDEYAQEGIMETALIVVSEKHAIGKTLGELDIARNFGVYVQSLRRMRQDLPRGLNLALARGDVLKVVGPGQNIDNLAVVMGAVERDSKETDLLTFALGITAGVLLGTLSITIAGTPIGLGSAGGLLVAGITVGFIRSIRPTFGRLPEATRWFLMEFGLLLFMIGVGLRAGGDIIETFSQAGPQLILAGIGVTVIPLLIAYLIGRKLLHLNPVILLGAITGAMTSGASLSIVTNEAKSELPSLGYTGTYAFANVFLTIAGTIIILLA